jgi:hypothetical protein
MKPPPFKRVFYFTYTFSAACKQDIPKDDTKVEMKDKERNKGP